MMTLAGLLKRRAREQGIPFKEVVNRTIRVGLGGGQETYRTVPRTKLHSFGFRPGVDLDKLGQLVDELEAESFVDKGAHGPVRRQRSRSRS